MSSTAIMWFRNDLRLHDNPALIAALEHEQVIPLYIHAPEEAEPYAPGEASCWWLKQSLESLETALQEKFNLTLQIRSGSSLAAIQNLIDLHDVESVYWNRRYEPALRRVDENIKKMLNADGLQVKSFNGSLIFEPWEIENQQGDPYRVFTPFYKRAVQMPSLPLQQLPDRQVNTIVQVGSKNLTIADLALTSTFRWYNKFEGQWAIGEDAAHDRLMEFVNDDISIYKDKRDRLADHATSRLSAHLHFGEISPRQILHVTQQYKHDQNERNDGAIEAFERQLFWRDFGHHLLYHYPQTQDDIFNQKYTNFPWQHDDELLQKWQRGETGIPLVDAGMRELWATGSMHNRARMIVASFLTKNLGLHWLDGARWFWNTLVDADLANNTLGWQWSAGCGADASPYYRIFNPVTQGQRFDANGDYIRRWLPELAHLPNKIIHAPWQASTNDRPSDKSDTLSPDYPEPIVDLAESRKLALERYGAWKDNAP